MLGAEFSQRRFDLCSRVSFGAGAKRCANPSLHERRKLQQVNGGKWRCDRAGRNPLRREVGGQIPPDCFKHCLRQGE